MNATLRDVAREAAVSIRTASRVINGSKSIRDETRRQVESAIEKLGYRPNIPARSLRTGRSYSLGMVIPQISNPFFPAVVTGAEKAAKQHGYTLMLGNTNDDPEAELAYLELLTAKRVDGIILCGSRLTVEELERVIQTEQVPLAVLTSRRPRHSTLVSIDGEAGLQNAVRWLIEHGHRKIGYVGWQVREHDERLRGYRQAMQTAGLSVPEAWTALVAEPNVRGGNQAACDLADRAPEITAVVCETDLMAVGVLQSYRALGLRVPEDISVIGFDDIPLSSLVTPTLTTLRVPCEAVGAALIETLLMAGREPQSLSEPTIFVPELIIRASTAECRR
jgi:LacI family transcriptional regulator